MKQRTLHLNIGEEQGQKMLDGKQNRRQDNNSYTSHKPGRFMEF